jgi:flagellar hook assembly protein FlgD
VVELTGRELMSDPVRVTTGAWSEDERVRFTSVGPSPSLEEVVVRFSMPRTAWARVGVYDAAGRLVRVLSEGPQAGGEHAVTWTGSDERGQRVGSGVYFVRLSDGRTAESRKIVVQH